MRRLLRLESLAEKSNVLIMPPQGSNQRPTEELTAFRGFVIAAVASIFSWGLCLSVLWLARSHM